MIGIIIVGMMAVAIPVSQRHPPSESHQRQTALARYPSILPLLSPCACSSSSLPRSSHQQPFKSQPYLKARGRPITTPPTDAPHAQRTGFHWSASYPSCPRSRMAMRIWGRCVSHSTSPPPPPARKVCAMYSHPQPHRPTWISLRMSQPHRFIRCAPFDIPEVPSSKLPC
jgi:hypothetical protein